MTRIIGGRAGGRRLSVPARGTRPTSDRVREALFSALDSRWVAEGTEWGQVPVLDLYAGSGALGLEALSRGAPAVVLVENARPGARVLAANVAAVDLPGAQVIVRDVATLATMPPVLAAGLVLADPPYDIAASDVASAITALARTGWIAPGALVVVERPSRDAQSPLPHSAVDVERRAYGDTVLWYGRMEHEALDAGPDARLDAWEGR